MRWLLFLLLPGPVAAITCASWASAKQAWEGSPYVFVGRVEHTVGGFPDSDLTAWVRVEEAFKGTYAGAVLLFHEPREYSGLATGQRRVFYAFPSEVPNRITWRHCWRSRYISRAADDLLFLRALPGSAKGTRISGSVDLEERAPDFGSRWVRHLAGARVKISGEESSAEVPTNADGVYEVFGLKPGKYSVSVVPPPGTALGSNHFEGDRLGSATEFHLGPDQGISIDFSLQVDNSISGRLLSPAGTAMSGVCMGLELPGGNSPQWSRSEGCTGSGGTFRFEHVPPGAYGLTANRDGKITGTAPFPKLYYPGAIRIGEGEHLTGIDFQVAEVARRIVLRGTLRYADGKPVAREDVEFKPSGGDPEIVSSDANGRFEITTLSKASTKTGSTFECVRSSRGSLWAASFGTRTASRCFAETLCSGAG